MKIYVSGPMTGYPNNNLAAFADQAFILREAGHEVISPGEFPQNSEGGSNAVPADIRANYLRKDIEALATCDGIYLLQGWQESIGANVELFVALALGLHVNPTEAMPRLDLVLNHVAAASRYPMEAHGSGYLGTTTR